MKCMHLDNRCGGNDNRSENRNSYFAVRNLETEFGECRHRKDGECTNKVYIAYFEGLEKKRIESHKEAVEEWELAHKQATKLECKFYPALVIYLNRNFPDWEYRRLKDPDNSETAVFIYDKRFKEFYKTCDKQNFWRDK